MLEFSTYHKILRISSAVVACVLLFQAGMVSRTTAILAVHTQIYLAGVIGAESEITPAKDESALMKPTATNIGKAIDEVAQQDGHIESETIQDRSTFVLAATLFIFLTLIVLNYALDLVRRREKKQKNLITKNTQNVHNPVTNLF